MPCHVPRPSAVGISQQAVSHTSPRLNTNRLARYRRNDNGRQHGAAHKERGRMHPCLCCVRWDATRLSAAPPNKKHTRPTQNFCSRKPNRQLMSETIRPARPAAVIVLKISILLSPCQSTGGKPLCPEIMLLLSRISRSFCPSPFGPALLRVRQLFRQAHPSPASGFAKWTHYTTSAELMLRLWAAFVKRGAGAAGKAAGPMPPASIYITFVKFMPCLLQPVSAKGTDSVYSPRLPYHAFGHMPYAGGQGVRLPLLESNICRMKAGRCALPKAGLFFYLYFQRGKKEKKVVDKRPGLC